VQRRKFGKSLYRPEYFLVNPDRGGEMSAAVDYAVSDHIGPVGKLCEKGAQHLRRHEFFAAEMLL